MSKKAKTNTAPVPIIVFILLSIGIVAGIIMDNVIDRLISKTRSNAGLEKIEDSLRESGCIPLCKRSDSPYDCLQFYPLSVREN